MPATSSRSSSLSLDVLTLFFDRIALHLPISIVIYLSQTHPILIDKLSPYLRQSFDELLALRVSRENVNSFRTLLLKTRAAISGSTALSFILRDSHWTPGDFDLYAPFGAGYFIVNWLVQYEGYNIVSDGSRSFIFHPHNVAVPDGLCDWMSTIMTDSSVHRPKHKYHSSSSDIYRVHKLRSTNNNSIDVIESSTPSFLTPIVRFHSTLVMNYITPTSIVVLYPKLTFKREGILQYRDENTLDSYDPSIEQQPLASVLPTTNEKEDYLKKYKHRGFVLFSRPADLRRPCGAACPSLRRTVSNAVDRWALHIPLSDTSSLEHASIVAPDTADSDTSSIGAPPSVSSNPASSQHPPPLSLTSSYVTDLTKSICEVSTPISTRYNGTRPELPNSHWVLRTPPSHDQLNYKRRPRRAACKNPFCPFLGLTPVTNEYDKI